jgi:hypothetical protein
LHHALKKKRHHYALKKKMYHHAQTHVLSRIESKYNPVMERQLGLPLL